MDLRLWNRDLLGLLLALPRGSDGKVPSGRRLDPELQGIGRRAAVGEAQRAIEKKSSGGEPIPRVVAPDLTSSEGGRLVEIEARIRP
jgi:hypothetical protein